LVIIQDALKHKEDVRKKMPDFRLQTIGCEVVIAYYLTSFSRVFLSAAKMLPSAKKTGKTDKNTQFGIRFDAQYFNLKGNPPTTDLIPATDPA
jgi:hypothetical protein